MKKGTKLLTIIIAATALTACSGQKSERVTSLQKRDKALSCKEVQLEINEAEFYRRTAEKNKGPKVENLVMPLGYISTYVSAEDAIDASDARIDYLNRIYEILDCDNPKSAANHMPPVNMNMVGGGGMAPARMNVMAPQQGMYHHDDQATEWTQKSWYY